MKPRCFSQRGHQRGIHEHVFIVETRGTSRRITTNSKPNSEMIETTATTKTTETTKVTAGTTKTVKIMIGKGETKDTKGEMQLLLP